jgi:hypothetical protein
MKKFNKIVLLEAAAAFLFVVAALLLLLDRYTSLSINNTIAHFILFYIAVSAVPIIIVAYVFGFKNITAILIVLFSSLSICFLFAFLTWGGDWKTQTVIYRNIFHPSQTIEFRMRGDRFAFGYKKQIVERKKILPFIDIIKDVDTSKVDPAEWQLTNERINELKIPGDYVDLPEK